MKNSIIRFFAAVEYAIRKPSSVVFGFSVALYSLMCTIYSDIIVAQNNDFMWLPWLASGQVQEDRSPIRIRKILPDIEEKNEDVLYVFVLDVSKSMLEETEPIRSSWYEEAIKKIKEEFPGLEMKSKVGDSLTGWDLARARLLLSLLHLFESSDKRVQDSPRFAVWIVGEGSSLVLPKDGDHALDPDGMNYIHMNRTNFFKACEEVNNIKTEDLSRSTDFLSLLKKILSRYEKGLEKGPGRATFVLTILSDLVHDPDSKLHRVRFQELEKEWQLLEEEIRRLSDYRIMANAVVYAKDNETIQRGSIYRHFKTHFDFYKLNREDLNGGSEVGSVARDDEILHLKMSAPEAIGFYYTNPVSIQNMSARIKFHHSYSLDVEIPGSISGFKAPDLNLRWRLMSGDHVKRSGKWSTGGGAMALNVIAGNVLELRYSGRLPPHSINVVNLRISVKEAYRTYFVPMIFLKTLPSGAATWMRFLHAVMILSGLFALYNLVVFFRQNGKKLRGVVRCVFHGQGALVEEVVGEEKRIWYVDLEGQKAKFNCGQRIDFALGRAFVGKAVRASDERSGSNAGAANAAGLSQA